MAQFLLLLVVILPLAEFCHGMPDFFWPEPQPQPEPENSNPPSTALYPSFYAESCPNAEQIVKGVLAGAMQRDPRIAASLLRLHFHDCFVQGCDGSILLDDSSAIQSEKGANPNRNSARGFGVVDEIKSALERECEGIVSCADLLAIAARDSVALSGGSSWEVQLGRRDSLSASRSQANSDIPAPNSTLSQLVTAFAKKGLSPSDMITLSGSHTIGKSRCASFSQRLYNHQNTNQPDPALSPNLLAELRSLCPKQGDGNVTTVLDFQTPAGFDNRYYLNLHSGKGLLNSDQVLLAESPNSEQAAFSGGLVLAYAFDQYRFLQAFADSMVKMGSISPLTGQQGEVRRNCRRVN